MTSLHHESPERAPSIRELESRVAAEPQSAAARLRLGTALAKLGRTRDAEKTLRECLELDSRCAGAWVNLGCVLLERLDFQGAIDANHRALELDPTITAAYFNQGLGHLYLGQAQEMLACFEEVVAREPRNGAAFYHLGVALQALGRTPEARLAVAYATELGHSPDPDLLRAFEASAKTQQDEPSGESQSKQNQENSSECQEDNHVTTEGR
jgi:tetratricopeptide (TPR) repeat protein